MQKTTLNLAAIISAALLTACGGSSDRCRRQCPRPRADGAQCRRNSGVQCQQAAP
ncbi:hypothetical protein [uncultured Cardiobacterium sp.]|uniref:hypothetical protein n=1 Tax=uncultured Cardiobacterium sp. TaxID=417619 RepID=UPI0026216F2D|nr:hypothetical protein [uncultured Cardiobacterium sp.]